MTLVRTFNTEFAILDGSDVNVPQSQKENTQPTLQILCPIEFLLEKLSFV